MYMQGSQLESYYNLQSITKAIPMDGMEKGMVLKDLNENLQDLLTDRKWGSEEWMNQKHSIFSLLLNIHVKYLTAIKLKIKLQITSGKASRNSSH